MKSYLLFLCAIVYTLFFVDLLPQVDAAVPPNILILLGDDIDKTSLGPWGGQAHTPHLDQLACDGIRDALDPRMKM